MKIRNGFVSNSSSSSFIVIDFESELKVPGGTLLGMERSNGVLEIGSSGEAEFGWGPDTIYDINSKINFCYLQIYYKSLGDSLVSDEWLEMLKTALMKIKAVREIRFKLTTDYQIKEGFVWGYIDHQSSVSSGCNTEMFDSQESLERFLFCQGSKIVLDNDNH